MWKQEVDVVCSLQFVLLMSMEFEWETPRIILSRKTCAQPNWIWNTDFVSTFPFDCNWFRRGILQRAWDLRIFRLAEQFWTRDVPFRGNRPVRLHCHWAFFFCDFDLVTEWTLGRRSNSKSGGNRFWASSLFCFSLLVLRVFSCQRHRSWFVKIQLHTLVCDTMRGFTEGFLVVGKLHGQQQVRPAIFTFQFPRFLSLLSHGYT